jgi:hypothetical protein
MTVARVLLYVVSAASELFGLALVVVGVRADRRQAVELLAQVADLQPRDAREQLMMNTGLGAAQVNAETAMRLHYQQIRLHAGELANAGRRQTVGVSLFVLGTLAGLVANLLSI